MLATTLLWAQSALLERCAPPELGRRAVLATAASALALRPAPARALDLDLAAETLKEGALCSSQSCILNTLEKLKPVLDIAGVPKNAKGDPAVHTPIVTLEPIYGTKREYFSQGYAKFSFSVTVPHPMDNSNPDYVRLLWIRGADGSVLTARAFSPADQGGFSDKKPGLKFPATLFGTLAEPALGGTAKLGATYTPMSYCTGHGLWEGKPFVLCDADDAACDASGILALPGPPLDTRARRKAEEVGRDVLARRAKLKS